VKTSECISFSFSLYAKSAGTSLGILGQISLIY
jgi:hypothetical protein